MTTSELITPSHLSRKALIYIRQSSPNQAISNQESLHMQYALKQETLDNSTSSCIGCGICVTVCPMDTLSYGKETSAPAAAASDQ